MGRNHNSKENCFFGTANKETFLERKSLGQVFINVNLLRRDAAVKITKNRVVWHIQRQDVLHCGYRFARLCLTTAFVKLEAIISRLHY